jgi:hypothetical protein
LAQHYNAPSRRPLKAIMAPTRTSRTSCSQCSVQIWVTSRSPKTAICTEDHRRQHISSMRSSTSSGPKASLCQAEHRRTGSAASTRRRCLYTSTVSSHVTWDVSS